MEVFEITGFTTGVSTEGVNYLQPSDSFQNIENGFIHRQVLQSRQGFTQWATQLTGANDDGSRVLGIFEFELKDGTFQTLAITKNYLYVYNEGTNAFDQIVNNIQNRQDGNPVTDPFGIAEPEYYISGTSYPRANGNDRFVFCGKGVQGIYQYSPGASEVQNYTDTGQNINYQQPLLNGVSTQLTNAHFVARFGERLNFFRPTIGATAFPQGILYSGIKDSSGLGDKYASVGSGILSGDTSETLNGITPLGNTMVIKFSRSDWTLEKTADAFNPYFIKKLPSTTGTSAPVSVVQWGQEARSVGREGVISTDLRISVRVDNKIPYFTRDDMDSLKFDLTYGGFDRKNSHFLWLYKSAGKDEADNFQDKILVNNYEENSWSTYTARFSVLGTSSNGQNLTWNDIIEANSEDGSWKQWNTTEEIWNKIGIGKKVNKTLAGDDFGFVYELNTDNDDYTRPIKAVSKAASAEITVSAASTIQAHSFAVGDFVSISGVTGMVDLNNFDPADPTAELIEYTITAITNTTVTVNVDSLEFDPADANTGQISKLITFSAELIPFNPYRSLGRKVYVSHVEFLVDTNGGFLTVDMIADEESRPFKSATLGKTDSLRKSRQWVTVSVNNESEFFGLRFKQSNPALQLKITSIRITAGPGGMTSG